MTIYHAEDSAREPWWRDENGPRNPFSPNGKMSFTWSSVSVKTIHIVEGIGNFPVDMLRYDHAFCLTPIPHPEHPWYARPFRVVVGFEDRYKPTIGRWESFGWIVGPFLAPLPNQLLHRVLSWRGTCHRCGEECRAYAMSIFDFKLICSRCEQIERTHPDFALARDTMRYGFKQGSLEFPGVGWPGVGVRLTSDPGSETHSGA